MNVSRRGILGGLAAAAVTSGLPRQSGASESGTATTRLIPTTGERIPVIGLGSWITFNVGNDPVLLDRCAKVMAAFVDDGGGMIDCSPMYGSSQETIGRGLGLLSDTSSIFSAEKVWTSSAPDGPGQIAETQRRWGVPGFDLLQVHNLQGWKGHLATLGAMKADSRLRYVGITTSHGRRHDLLEEIMSREPIDFVQLTYNVQDREAERRLLPLAQERGIGVIVNRPFRRGALIRRFEGKPLPSWANEIDARSWAQVLLKFIISHPAVTVAIPATQQVDHLQENKAAGQGALPDEALRRRMAADIASL